MPNKLSGTVRPGDFILSENDQVGALSRDNLTVTADLVFAPGEIAGIVTATGRVAKFNPALSNGAEVAAVIPVYPVATPGALGMHVFVTRNAALKEDGLVWPVGITGPQKAAAIAQLAERGLIIRPRSYVG